MWNEAKLISALCKGMSRVSERNEVCRMKKRGIN